MYFNTMHVLEHGFKDQKMIIFFISCLVFIILKETLKHEFTTFCPENFFHFNDFYKNHFFIKMDVFIV